ncbi:MAG: DUF3048 domain-containing protein [Lachnospiraceae bacterium]|nr:DUF3048 domain-containing protein [Lachnospiraceae bacterium]
MKKKLFAMVLVLISALGLMACASDEEVLPDFAGTPIVNEDPISDTTNSEGIVTGLTIVDRPVIDGKKQSYLTGEWKAEEVVNRRPMAVMIPNTKAALPQYGISKASVIFEAPMEWLSCTRLMAVIEDYDALDHIGPIRSSRHYFVYEAMSLDAIYCNWGLTVPYAGPLINSDRVDNISASVLGLEVSSDEAFARDEKRKAAGYSTEYTGIMTIDGYNAAVARHGYETNYRDTFEPTFTFAQDGNISSYSEFEDATKISPGGYTSGAADGGYAHALPYFIYNSADHLYHRYQFGEPQIDEMNGEELTCTNVVFMLTNGDYFNDGNGYLDFNMCGNAPAYIFTEGKVIPGYWLRNTEKDSAPFKYYDASKEEIVFNQGKTWICLVWDEYSDFITYE